ncbi:MAG: SMC-Scp complex subunit ScpB [Candidatus Omnitrophica bacterium]|nr:SMC-Scp complex subunit ScpB [Candidatus Omnitrophota bacterium]MBD3269419.1 SMC-Scp complex subunit ScpB [Candidatus Omnitrophota bacterium]
MGESPLKAIIESLLFVNERPIELSELADIIEMDKKDINKALEELSSEYSQRGSGICIVKVAGGYQMCSSPENEPWLKKMYRDRNKQKLSTASLETLAIIAYKQPVTRIEIESIRGVNVDGVVKKLTELGLIKIGGRKEVVGKPFLYITTRKFLEYFGINSLKELPKLEDFIALAEKEKILEQENQQNQSGVPEEEPLAAASDDLKKDGNNFSGSEENKKGAGNDSLPEEKKTEQQKLSEKTTENTKTAENEQMNKEVRE